ncbi:glycoprotein-N-acetylgalactosamine 3-beta-galactosyltransferase 1-like [Clavelina lepadiformis]|uniref:glycoprotein-N-acetylgalactosamine 3-beta-galactosyltransferase 1-like n=1 Tax=Clavelina lepadiformis TaxID=159417 RepID=UPI0040412C2C
MTSPRTLYTKAVHVRETWGKRCNKILFFSSVVDKDFPAIGLNVQEGRGSLYDKTRQAFQHIWTHYRDQADWFMKTDDDTFVILENLRFLLKDYDHNQPMYFGRKFKRYIEQGYMSGGAGYVLSRAALNRYAMAMSKRRCPKGYNIEDLELGKCLSYIGVKAMDSRDYRKRETFFPFAPEYHLRPGKIPAESWYWKYIYYPNPSGPECCSDFAISFHYIEPDMMYVLEYFVYKLNVFGMHQVQQKKDPSNQLPVSNYSLQTDNVS